MSHAIFSTTLKAHDRNFAPSNTHLGGQYLIAQNHTDHHRKLAKNKPGIDMSCPRSYYVSPIANLYGSGPPRRPRSAGRRRPTSAGRNGRSANMSTSTTQSGYGEASLDERQEYRANDSTESRGRVRPNSAPRSRLLRDQHNTSGNGGLATSQSILSQESHGPSGIGGLGASVNHSQSLDYSEDSFPRISQYGLRPEDVRSYMKFVGLLRNMDPLTVTSIVQDAICDSHTGAEMPKFEHANDESMRMRGKSPKRGGKKKGAGGEGGTVDPNIILYFQDFINKAMSGDEFVQKLEALPKPERRQWMKTLVTRYRQVEHLLEASSLMSSDLDVYESVNKICEAAKQLVDADTSNIFILGENKDDYWTYLLGEGKHSQFDIGSGIPGYVLKAGESLNVKNAYIDPRFDAAIERVTGYGTKAVLCIPVSNQKGDVLAALHVMNTHEGTFSRTDEIVLQTLAIQAGNIISNCITHASLQGQWPPMNPKPAPIRVDSLMMAMDRPTSASPDDRTLR